MAKPTTGKKSAQLIDTVLQRVADGETLSAICKDVGLSTVAWHQWVKTDPALAARFEEARQIGYDALAESALAIVDAEPERIYTTTTGDDGATSTTTSRYDGAAVSWAKNRADLRLKLLSKWHAGKYGDKATVDLGNKPGESFKTEGAPSPEAQALALQIAEAFRDAARGK